MKYLLIFSAFFTVLHAQNYTCGRDKINVAEYISENNSSQHDLMMIKKGQMNWTFPRPRETLIDVVPLSSFDPPVISVKRCYGYCPPPLNYKPLNTTKKQIILNHRYNDAENKREKKYILIDVEEHVNCSRCMCLISEDDCMKENKRFNSYRCACM